jgi:hypothetical protein
LKSLEDEETTLGDIIDKAKLQFIHFYLRTRLQKQISDDYDDRQKEEEHDHKSGSDELSSAESGIEGYSFEPCFIRTSSSAPSMIFPGLSFDSVDRSLTLQEIADVLLILDCWSCSSSFYLSSSSSEICAWSLVRK